VKGASNGLGAVKGKPAGGKVLPKETLPEGTIDFLKKYSSE
jgi:hypothetical protein